jgi:flagellar hook-associated protein 1 FlgK
MGTLLGSMSIAMSGLEADQTAVQVTSNNITNASTPGYDRQIPIFAESEPTDVNGIMLGDGVTVQGIQSVRDNVLNLQLNSETQQQSSLSTYVSGMQQVEAIFNEASGVGLSSAIDGFFSSIQALSANPSDSTLRQAVVDAGGTLAEGFSSASTQLQQVQSGVNQDVTQTVGQINSLASQIAALNQQIASVQGVGQGDGDLVGQRDEALSQLASLVGTSTVSADDGSVTVTVGGGSPLVVGNQAYQLTTQASATTGMNQVYSQGSNITAQITGGELGGDIQVRDQEIPTLQSNLDNLAASMISNVNSANEKGYALNGAQGGDFFTPFTPSTPGSNQGAAASMSMYITDPSQVAASSDGSAGSSGNLENITNLQTQNIIGGQTYDSYYANFVAGIGNSVSSASASLDATGLIVQQLQSQKSSVSGVSLDEEAANLVKYQQAYEAAAQVVSTIDNLSDFIITNLGDQASGT